MENVTKFRSTFAGILSLVLSGLVLFNLIDIDTSHAIGDSLTSIQDIVISLVAAISGFVNIFKSRW